MSLSIVTVTLQYEDDVVVARQRARQIAGYLGFDAQDQTRIATAVSEIARNALMYAGAGRVEFSVEGRTPPQVLVVRVTDRGPGIANLGEILACEYRSSTGLGLGLLGARRLMDRFEIDATPGRGTTVWLRKLLPTRAAAIGPPDVVRLADRLATEAPRGGIEVIRSQNQELLQTLDELRRRQDELVALNRELEETNRGVLALYAELDERADHLRRADQLKSRFLSNMSHEFRTPLNSILALSQLLLERESAPRETLRQDVQYIRMAATQLSNLVDDLLDLAKVEAGKMVVRAVPFSVSELFGTLRGMLRPLLLNSAVELVFEPAEALPAITSDEAKVSQILRNFLSNALKFTERGEIRVSAHLSSAGDDIVLDVRDTGIGIAPEDQAAIFDEFTQVDHALQRRVRGTGLGLPLTRRLAQLLGGEVGVESEPGVGSRFWLRLPVAYRAPQDAVPEAPLPARDPNRLPVLVVEDGPATLLVYERYLADTPFQLIAARSVAEAQRTTRTIAPRAIVLDIRLQGVDSWAYLAELKADPALHDVPVIVATEIDDRHKAFGLGADAYAKKPVDRRWLVSTLERLTGWAPARPVLLIDDDPVTRYVVRRLLPETEEVVEAANGTEGLERARALRPRVILLDLLMDDLSGFEVLKRLREDVATAEIPVVVLTSKPLAADEHAHLSRFGAAVLSKEARDGGIGEHLRHALAQLGIGTAA